MTSIIKTSQDMNMSVLTSSGSWVKYGVGITEFSRKIKDMTKSVGLTQSELLKFSSVYEKGFNNISLNNMDKLLGNIKNAVGANSQSMQEMLSGLSGVVGKYGDLEQSMVDLSSYDKSRLTTTNELLVLTGNMSLSQTKQLQDYINQNEQKNDADIARKGNCLPPSSQKKQK